MLSSKKLTKEVDSLVGKPFALHGRGPDAFDCLGLVIWLYREVYGVDLPDPLVGAPMSHQDMRRLLNSFLELPCAAALEAGDLIHAYSRHQLGLQHLAVFESRESAVEAYEPFGVRRVKPEEILAPEMSWKRYKRKCWD